MVPIIKDVASHNTRQLPRVKGLKVYVSDIVCAALVNALLDYLILPLSSEFQTDTRDCTVLMVSASTRKEVVVHTKGTTWLRW